MIKFWFDFSSPYAYFACGITSSEERRTSSKHPFSVVLVINRVRQVKEYGPKPTICKDEYAISINQEGPANG